MRQSEVEKAEAIAKLREWIKPGDTVYTILDHVSASGMSRAIRVVLPLIKAETREPLSGEPRERDALSVDFLHPNWAVGKAIGLRHWKRNGSEQDALVMGGCGTDMGFELVYNLGRVLYPNGFECIGDRCHSNDHSNGDRDRTPHVHSDGGYALAQRWL